MNNDNFLIENSDLDIVKELCASIKDTNKRNRAVANMLAAEISKKYFTEIELDEVTSLHEVSQILEDIDISDIYIKNNYVDVRIYFEDKLPTIPMCHVKNGILPLAYMFIKINSDLSAASVTGFLLSSSLDTQEYSDEYITLSEDSLVSYYDLENSLAYNDEVDLSEELEINIYKYLDNQLEDKSAFYNMLIKSPEARTKLKNAARTKMLLNSVSLPETTDSKELINTDIQDNTTTEEVFNDDALQGNETDDLLVNTDNEDDISVTLDENIDTSLELDSEEFNTEELIEFDSEGNETEELMELDTEEFDTEELIELDSEKNETEELMEIESEDVFETETSEVIDTFEEHEEITDLEMAEQEDNFEGLEEDVTTNISDEEIETSEFESAEELKLVDNDDNFETGFETLETGSSEYIQPEVIIEETELAEETSDFQNFSTNATPSLNAIEASDNIEINEEELIKELENNNIVENQNEEIEQTAEYPENNTEIDTLFNEEDFNSSSSTESSDDKTYEINTQKKGNPIKLIGLFAIIIALGYYSYTKYFTNEMPDYQQEAEQKIVTDSGNNTNTTEPIKQEQPVAMPIETVENTKNVQQTNEAVTETISAIENNLDTSILVSNLSIKWEVPASYISSGTAKRYFTKLGKILQLNLKTELLLLSKPPITNKILVELEYNKNNQKFEIKNMLVSSGEKIVDEVIKNTINNALNIKLNMNMGVFENITGNPVLVIHL